MKFVKKLTALFLAIVMTMAMGITAFAENPTYTITAPANRHTYKIYQVFTGSFNSEREIQDAQWGSNAKSSYTGAVDASILKTLGEKDTDAKVIAYLKDYVDLTGTPAGSVTNGSSASVESGYYLITDKDEQLQDKDDAYSLYLVKIVDKNITITPKTGTPTVEKKVKDVNDSQANSTTDWQDSADYDIGDTIPYQLTATMGDISNYDKYYVEFVDTMTHLTYTKITSVKVGDTALTEGQYTATWDATKKELKVSIEDVKAYGAAKDTKVVVEYEATLDEDAVVGSTGNPNEVYLKYSNNPNNAGSGETGKTPTDKNIVFTYTVTANKVNTKNENIAGATFELFKKNSEGTYVSLGAIATSQQQDGTYSSSWVGVDDGDYKIVETVVPDGYTKVDDIEFTISATHDETSDNPQLKTLTGGNIFTGSVDTGVLTGNIVNKTSSELPETGGMGTTVLYVAGIAMIIAAGVVVIARKRMA